jgi:amidase
VTELHDLTALDQGDAVRRGEVSPRELAAHYLGRADDVGAFVTRTPELAVARAGSLLPVPDDAGPLYGVPTAIKDLNLTAGVRTTFGSAAYADFVPDTSDGITLSIEGAGMVSLGKTNTPEFGSPCYTEPDVAPPAVRARSHGVTAGGATSGSV